jgi:hypothetical protein
MALIHCFDTSAGARFLRGRGAPLMMRVSAMAVNDGKLTVYR